MKLRMTWDDTHTHKRPKQDSKRMETLTVHLHHLNGNSENVWLPGTFIENERSSRPTENLRFASPHIALLRFDCILWMRVNNLRLLILTT